MKEEPKPKKKKKHNKFECVLEDLSRFKKNYHNLKFSFSSFREHSWNVVIERIFCMFVNSIKWNAIYWWHGKYSSELNDRRCVQHTKNAKNLQFIFNVMICLKCEERKKMRTQRKCTGQLKCGKRVRANRVTFGWIDAERSAQLASIVLVEQLPIYCMAERKTRDSTTTKFFSSSLSLSLSVFPFRSLTQLNEDDCMF